MKLRQKIRSGIIFISFLLFPVTIYYLSPGLSPAGLAAGIISGSLIVFFLQFLSSLILGRAFCGWICPAGGFQDVIGGIRVKPVRKGNFVKWIIWTPWFLLLVFFAVTNLPLKFDLFYQMKYGISVTDIQGLITYYAVLFIIAVPAFIIGKRSFCHHICWMAPFMILGLKLRNLLKLPGLRLSSNDNCTHCGTCSKVCPMSLNIRKSIENNTLEKESECIMCGKCVDNCPKSALFYKFGKAE